MSLQLEARNLIRCHAQGLIKNTERVLADFCNSESSGESEKAFKIMQNQVEQICLLEVYYTQEAGQVNATQLLGVCRSLEDKKTQKNKDQYLQLLSQFYRLLDNLS